MSLCSYVRLLQKCDSFHQKRKNTTLNALVHFLEKDYLVIEIDSAANNQVFLDFLAQLRYHYLERAKRAVPAFHSVILAGVYDIRRLRMKIRPEDEL